MDRGYIDINSDQAVKVRIHAIFGNSLLLDFTFLDKDKQPINVSNVAFAFTFSDDGLRRAVLVVSGNQWTRVSSCRIKKSINPLPLGVGKYKIDFTATFPDGVVQTVMDGELIIRERLKAR